MIITPDYYENFKCINKKCTHNCCIGWEIDIDEETYKKYKKIDGDFGNKLLNNINNDESPHFRLDKNDRCPFLNKDNLCDIITTLGEESLCQICSDHPRFRNYFEDRTEIGLGLCCEAAAKLILSKKTLTTFTEPKTDDNFIRIRNRIYSIIQNRNISVEKRVSCLLDFSGLDLTAIMQKDWKKVYSNLEVLDTDWLVYISNLDKLNTSDNTKLDIPYEQLLIYLIYRHLSPAVYDGMFSERILFIVLSYYIIKTLNKNDSLEDLIEISRMYSSEIEYSTENIDILLEALS